jgi:starch phosphorylase
VGEENFFLFGLTAAEVQTLKAEGYNPMDIYHSNPELKVVIDLISEGYFSGGDRELFRPLVNSLLHGDPYMLLADFQSFVDCQNQVSQAYLDYEHWTRTSILNVARSGKFSSDRTIKEYCQDIWNVTPVKIDLLSQDELRKSMLD